MITVFTPTYNRCHLIDRLYKSLLTQTSKDFEWVVVDDGSTDNTEDYFSELVKKDNPFEIIYKKQPNGGKHRAINAGVKIARGELFFIVDSDDYLLPDAIEKLLQWRSDLDGSHKWAGISGSKGYTPERNVGGTWIKSIFVDAKNTQRHKYNLEGDKAEAYFTDVLRKYPFPEFVGENFITEEAVWNAIAADGYYLRWYNDIIYICEYIEGGLTRCGDEKYKNNPNGVLYWARVQIKAFPRNIRKKLGAVKRYYNVVHGKKSVKQIARDLGISIFFCRIAVIIIKLHG